MAAEGAELEFTADGIAEVARVVIRSRVPGGTGAALTVDGGRIVKITGAPEQPFTDGFACAKVNRDAEVVHSPLRVRTPASTSRASEQKSFGRRRARQT